MFLMFLLELSVLRDFEFSPLDVFRIVFLALCLIEDVLLFMFLISFTLLLCMLILLLGFSELSPLFSAPPNLKAL